MNDTPPEIVALVHQRLMRFTGPERMEMGSRMFDAARDMVLASFPPDLGEAERRFLLCERLHGKELADRFRKWSQVS